MLKIQFKWYNCRFCQVCEIKTTGPKKIKLICLTIVKYAPAKITAHAIKLIIVVTGTKRPVDFKKSSWNKLIADAPGTSKRLPI